MMDRTATSNMVVPEDTEALQRLYADFEAEHLKPLWTQIDDLMPVVPNPKAVPHVWKWSTLYPLAKRSGDLVPVGRGGERRAIGLANPGLGGGLISVRRCGPRSNIWDRAKPRPNIAMPRMPSVSSLKARAYGLLLTATPFA